MFIRSIIFDIFFAITTVFFAIFGIPLGISKKLSPKLAKSWAISVLFLLEKICKIKSKCDDINQINSCNLILSKHQSTWETIFFLAKIKNVSFVIKEELTKIPFYGWYLKNMGMIPVKRKISPSELKYMNEKIQSAIKNGRTVVIFPQGTRILSCNFDVNFKLNCLEIFKNISGKIGLISLNSGKFWKKGLFKIKNKGTIISSLVFTYKIDKQKYQKMTKDEILDLKNKISIKIEEGSRDL